VREPADQDDRASHTQRDEEGGDTKILAVIYDHELRSERLVISGA
jgi:hypothetical protein